MIDGRFRIISTPAPAERGRRCAARLTAALLVPLARSSDTCWADRWRSRFACLAGSDLCKVPASQSNPHHVFHCCQFLPLPAGPPPPPSSCASHHGPAPGVRGASPNAVRGGVLPPVDDGGGDLHEGDATAKVGVVWCCCSRCRRREDGQAIRVRFVVGRGECIGCGSTSFMHDSVCE